MAKSCYYLDTSKPLSSWQWNFHSNLNEERTTADGAKLGNKYYIIGGNITYRFIYICILNLII